MTSKASAPGTFNAEDRFHRFQSPLGGITLAASRRGLRGLWFEDQRHFPSLPTPFTDTADGVLIKAEQQVLAYLSGRRRQFDLILDHHIIAWSGSLNRLLNPLRTYRIGNSNGEDGEEDHEQSISRKIPDQKGHDKNV